MSVYSVHSTINRNKVTQQNFTAHPAPPCRFAIPNLPVHSQPSWMFIYVVMHVWLKFLDLTSDFLLPPTRPAKRQGAVAGASRGAHSGPLTAHA